MKFLDRQNASTLFCFTLFASLLSLLIVGILSTSTVQKVKIGSEMHADIIEGKDLVADILPPPAYIIEAYQVAGQILRTGDNARLDQLHSTLLRLKKEYDDRLTYWNSRVQEHTGDTDVLAIFESLEKIHASQPRSSLQLPRRNCCQPSKQVMQNRPTRSLTNR